MTLRNFDPARLSALGYPDEPMIDMIVESFLARLVSDLDALDEHDRDEVARLTHRLRGATGSLGFLVIEDFLTPARITVGSPWRDELQQLVREAGQAYAGS